MRENFIKLAAIALLGLGIFIVIVYFMFFYSKYHSKPQTPGDTKQNTTPKNLESQDAFIPENSPYPLHTGITATVFWVGEPVGGGSSENNALSAWDDAWQEHYGCFDDPFKRNGYYPEGCTPKENPFYFDLPYDDFDWDTGNGRRANAYQVVPWADSQTWGENESMLKNRWIKIIRGNDVCYAQWEDAGPYVYDDAQYVFGSKDERPKSAEANNAGMDVSPAVRDCLNFEGLNNDTNKVSWQFIEPGNVPSGPWKDIVTTSGTFWR